MNKTKTATAAGNVPQEVAQAGERRAQQIRETYARMGQPLAAILWPNSRWSPLSQYGYTIGDEQQSKAAAETLVLQFYANRMHLITQ